MAESSTVPSPEQELLDHEALSKATARFPEWLVTGFVEGQSAEELSKKSGLSVPTIYRKKKELERAIIKEFEIKKSTCQKRGRKQGKRARTGS